MNSFTPANIATTPNRIEIAYDGRVVPLEHEQCEDEPGDPGHEEDPPAIGGLLEDLARPEHLVHRSSLDGCAVAARFSQAGRTPPVGSAAMIVERSMHPGWLSNAFLLADEPGGTAVFVDSGAPLEPLLDGGRARAGDADAPPRHARARRSRRGERRARRALRAGGRRPARSRRAGSASKRSRRRVTRTTASRSSSATCASRATRSSATPSAAGLPTRCVDRSWTCS